MRLRRCFPRYELATELSNSELSERTARGVGWTVFWRIVTRALGLISTFILARLLAPADFGLFALAASLSAAIDVLATTGAHDVLIRQRGNDRALYDTAFTLTMIRGLITASVLAAIAAPAAGFFHDPRLTPVMFAFALAALIESLENVGTVDFRKYLRFDREFVLFLLPRILGILVTIAASFLLRSYWSIVIGVLAQKSVGTILGYVLHPYRPRLSLAAWRRILSFSVWMWADAVSFFARTRSDMMILGRMLNPFDVGVFIVASEIATLPTTELVSPLCRVLMSTFSAARNLNADVRAAFRRAAGVTAAFSLPAGAGVALLSPGLVVLMLGPKWSGAIPLVTAMAPLVGFGAIGSVGGVLLRALGRPRSLFYANAVLGLIRIALLIIFASLYGVIGACWAVSCVFPLECVLLLGLSGRSLGITIPDWISEFWRSIISTAAMVATLIFFGLASFPASSDTLTTAAHLATAVFAGAAVYATVHIGLWCISACPDGPERFFLDRLVQIVGHELAQKVGRPADFKGAAYFGEKAAKVSVTSK